jgi:hypothetical protein
MTQKREESKIMFSKNYLMGRKEQEVACCKVVLLGMVKYVYLMMLIRICR